MRICNDFDTSIRKAMWEADPFFMDYPGLIICGSHTPLNTEQMIRDIQEARISGLPFFGECFGHQLACIEWARNKMGMRDAVSEEFHTAGTLVVRKRPELKVGLHDGESWWSNYEVIPEVENDFTLNKPINFFTAPFHPSYQSDVGKPHKLIRNFMFYAKGYAQMANNK